MSEPVTPNNNDSQEMPNENISPAARPRTFTIKSVIFGSLGLLFTIWFTAINDIHMGQTSFVANHLPPGPIFLVIAIALIWNPMWHYKTVLWSVGLIVSTSVGAYNHTVLDHSFWLSWHWLILLATALCALQPIWSTISSKCVLNGRELIVALIIILAGCWTAGASLNYHFTPTQISAWTIYSNNVQMQNVETIEYIPEHLWPSGGLTKIGDDQLEKQRVYDAWRTGYKEQGTDGVPWDAWLPSVIGSWVPLFIFFSICIIALSLLVHRQWAHHEQLAYPIAEIGTTIFNKSESRALPDIFYNKIFWIAALLVIAFHGIRYIHVWFPNNSPDIKTGTYFRWILDLFPVLKKSGTFSVNRFNFFFSIIGICYFLSREIGLSISIAPFLLALLSAQMYISTGVKISADDSANMRAGAYAAYAAIILYTGRHYYWAVLKKALTFKPANDFEEDGVFATRMLIMAFIGVIFILSFSFNLDVPLAILFSITGLLLFLVFSRIVCETGIPYVQAAWEPAVVMIKAMGISAVGATPAVLLYYISAIMFADPKEALMPYVANSLKMAEDKKFKLKKIMISVIIISSVAVVLSIGTRLYQQYTMGGNKLDYPWADYNVPHQILSNSTRDLTLLEDLGQRTAPGDTNAPGFFSRLGFLNPDSKTITYLFAGACGVGLFFFLRFRFTGFPLHPVLFLIMGMTPNFRTFYSFLIGWFIREAIVRFGGGKIYQNCKPFFIGLIFAELFMGIVGVGVGTIYCLFNEFTGRPPAFTVILG